MYKTINLSKQRKIIKIKYKTSYKIKPNLKIKLNISKEVIM